MIGLLWNCRGVSKKGMSSVMKDLLSEYQVDFAGFQETIKKKHDDNFFRKIDLGNFFTWH